MTGLVMAVSTFHFLNISPNLLYFIFMPFSFFVSSFLAEVIGLLLQMANTLVHFFDWLLAMTRLFMAVTVILLLDLSYK